MERKTVEYSGVVANNLSVKPQLDLKPEFRIWSTDAEEIDNSEKVEKKIREVHENNDI